MTTKVKSMHSYFPTRRTSVLVLSLLLLAGRSGHAAELAAAAVDLAFGVQMYESGGDDEAAAELFAAAASENPRDGTALHWLGLTYLRSGQAAKAVASLEASLKAPEPAEAGRERVKADLAAARAALSGKAGLGQPVTPPPYAPEIRVPWAAPRWDLRLSGGAGHDSNPDLLAEDLAFTTASGKQVQGGTGDGVGDLGLRAEIHPFYGRRGWSLGIAATADRSFHRDLSELDLTLASGLVQLAWGGDPDGFLAGPLGYTRVPPGNGRLALLFQAGGTDARLGGDPFLRAGEAAASLLVRETPATATRVDLSGVDRSYSNDASGVLRQSGRESTLGVSQLVFFSRRDRYLRLGLAAGERSAGEAYASTSRTAFAEASLPLSRRLTLFAAGERREDSFTHTVSNLFRPAGTERDDVTWRVTTAAVFALSDRLRWTLRGSFARRRSNVDVVPGSALFDYQRTVVSTGFDWSL